jgi:hypothetical protein
MVQVVENWSDIEGEVRSVRDSELKGYKTVEMFVEDAKAVEAFPNLLKQRVGEVIAVNVPEPRVESFQEAYQSGHPRVTCRVRLAGPTRFFAHPERLG